MRSVGHLDRPWCPRQERAYHQSYPYLPERNVAMLRQRKWRMAQSLFEYC